MPFWSVSANVDVTQAYRWCKEHGRSFAVAYHWASAKSSGSGPADGPHKILAGNRLEQTGARWRVRRVNNRATLCAVLYGDQWKKYGMQAK